MGCLRPTETPFKGYSEGYQFNVYQTLEAAKAAFGAAPGSQGIGEFSPDRFDYDPDLGYAARKQEG